MANPRGSFIWYELMTTDPVGAADFYDAVVGWKIARQRVSGPDETGGVDYRMIGRSDGGNAGGVLTLTYTHAQASGVTYEVETSTDLVAWTTAGVTQGTPDANNVVTATIALDVPGRFLRLKVSLTPTP